MSNHLQTRVNEAASVFVATVIDILQGASLKDLSSGTIPNIPFLTAQEGPQKRDTLPAPPMSAPDEEKAPWETEEPAPPSERRIRATSAEVTAEKQRVLGAAQKFPSGFQRGDIARTLGKTAPSDLTRILTLLVGEGALKKKGERKATRYWVPLSKMQALQLQPPELKWHTSEMLALFRGGSFFGGYLQELVDVASVLRK